MSESLDPGSQAILTHSPWRGLAATRACALFALAGMPAVPCSVLFETRGALMSADDMWAMCSSTGARWQAVTTPTMAQLAAKTLMVFTGCSLDRYWTGTADANKRAKNPGG